MGQDNRRFGRATGILLLIICLACSLGGCAVSGSASKIADLEFTVTPENELPQALADIIAQKKENPFKLTYSNAGKLYIVVGYGRQETGGYSIQVPQLYYTQESIVIDTELIGPKTDTVRQDSYPYIAVCLDDMELPVIFQ